MNKPMQCWILSGVEINVFRSTRDERESRIGITSALVTTICKIRLFINIESVALRKKSPLHWSRLQLEVWFVYWIGLRYCEDKVFGRERRGEDRVSLNPIFFFYSTSFDLYQWILLPRSRWIVGWLKSRWVDGERCFSWNFYHTIHPSPFDSSQNLPLLLYSLRTMQYIRILTD